MFLRLLLTEVKMNHFNDPFRDIQNLMNQMSAPYRQMQDITNRMLEPARIAQQHFDRMQAIVDLPLQQFYASQLSIQSALNHVPMDSLINIQTILERHSASLIPSLGILRNSIPFEQISQLDLTFLDEINIEETEFDETSLTDEMRAYIQQEVEIQVQEATSNTTTEWQQFIMRIYRSVPLYVFLMLLHYIFTPFQEYVMEEPQAYMQEIWEDKTGIDMTGETVAMIREDTYLRAGRSKKAPLVLQEPLKKAQSVLRITRKKNWVQVSVLIDGETYSGWVEKSKVIQP